MIRHCFFSVENDDDGDRISWSPDGLSSVARVTLGSDPLASTSGMLGLQVCTITPVYEVPGIEPRASCSLLMLQTELLSQLLFPLL